MLSDSPTLTRYILKRMLLYFSIIFIVFFLIGVSTKATDILSSFVSRNLPVESMLTVFWSYIPETFLVIFGLALFLSVVMTITSLNQLSEMPVLYSLGLSRTFLAKCVVLFLVPWSVLLLWLPLSYVPYSKIEGIKAFREAQASIKIELEPNRLQTIGKSMVYIQSEQSPYWLGFMAQLTNAKNQTLLISAKQAEPFFKQGQPWIRFKDAYQITADINQPISEFSHFEALELSLPQFTGKGEIQHPNDVDFKPPSELIQQLGDPLYRTELYWRLSYLISALLMALLAVFLVPYKPRSGKMGYIAISLLIFMLYATLLTALKNTASEGKINPEVAFLSVYLMLSMSLTWLWRKQKV